MDFIQNFSREQKTRQLFEGWIVEGVGGVRYYLALVTRVEIINIKITDTKK